MKMKNVEDIYALSSMQQLMLWQAVSTGRGEALVEQLTCTLEGPLHVNAFQRAWQNVMGRHPLLRTAFLYEGLKKPVQVVRQQLALPWRQVDLREAQPDEREARFAELIQARQQAGFDVARAPLFGLLLARVAEDRWRFAWSCHHLILDGWCLPLVLKEVFTSYAAFVEGKQPPLEPARGFRDYVSWLSKQDASAAEAFWGKRLAGYRGSPALPFPAPAASLDAEEDRYGEAETVLSAEATLALQQLARQYQFTLATLVQGVWSVMLGRYSGESDIVSGATVSGRPPALPGVETIVGPFSNNLPVRVNVSPQAACAEWLRELHQQLLEGREFEHSTPDQIQNASDLLPGRRMFDSLVVFENYPLDPRLSFRPGNVAISEIHGSATAALPLTLIAIPGAQLTLRLRYDRRQFSNSSGMRIASHAAASLTELSSGLPETLAGLFTLPAAEAARITDDWNPVTNVTATGPLAGEQYVHVIDSWGLCPIEVPGDLLMEASGDSAGESSMEGAALERTGCRARWLADGQLEYLGSEADSLAVGMYRVDPVEMAKALIENRMVTDAAVLARQNQSGEMRLIAYVVPNRDTATVIDPEQQGMLLPELRSHLKKVLPHRPLPAVVRPLDVIPRLADGSVDVAQLPSLSRARPESCGGAVPARSRLEARLVEIWSDTLGIQPIGVTDNFQELGGTSLDAVAMVSRIEEQFARKVPLVSLVRHPTVENLARLLRRSGDDAGESSLITIRPGGNRPPLFCVHPAGGTIYCYLALASHLPDDVPIYGLQARGIDGEAAPHTTVEDMAAYYAEAIRGVQPSGPYQLCGWSSGGILTFEVARQLESQAQDLALVALFDAGMRKAGQAFDERDFLPMLMLLFPHEDPEFVEELQRKSADQQLEYFRERAELARVVMEDSEAGLARHVFAVFQANVKAIVEYDAQPCRSKLTVFRAQEKATPMHEDPYLGWSDYTEAGVDVIEVPGNHVAMFREPTVKVVARHLEQLLK